MHSSTLKSRQASQTEDFPSSPTPRGSPVPNARLGLVILLCINLVNYIDRYILAAVEPLIARDVLPANDPSEQSKMGLLATAFMVSYMLTAPIFGFLGDRFGRWTLVGIGVVLWSIASGFSGASHDIGKWIVASGVGWISGFGVLLLTRCFVGVGEGAYGPVAPSIISDMYPVERRGVVLSWFYLAIPVGSALGYVLGGEVGPRWGWQWAFYCMVLPGIALGVLCFFRKDPREVLRTSASAASTPHRATWQDYKSLIHCKSYVFNVLGMTAMTFAVGGVSFWMPRYVAKFRMQGDDVVLQHVNLVFGAIVVVTGIAATLLGGWAGDKLRARFPGSYFLVSGAAMLIGFPLFLLVMITPFPWCWGVIALACFALFFNTGPSNTIIANVTKPALRSSAFALCILVIHLFGDAISPSLIGLANDRAGGNMNAGFGLVSGAILIAGVLWLIGAKYLDTDTRRATTQDAAT